MIRWKTLSVAALLAGLALPVVAAEPKPDSPALEHRVDGLLHKLTLEQEVALLGGTDGFDIRAEPSIGLPALAMSDGPYGVRMGGDSTAYAAGIALAASWDPALAQRVGAAMGRDARARGIGFLLGPGVNIYRAPQNGRNMEYYGEDPYLAGSTAVGLINGIQSQGVVATIKHFAANNAEYDRRQLNSVIAPRPLHEIYLRAFEMAVKQGHVGAVMSSYNQLDGQYTAENRDLVSGILKHDWGFDGIFMSDWGAVDDGLKAFKAGLDLEMPAADKMQPALLLSGLRDGTLSMAALDDKVRRILRTAVRFGFLDRPQRELAQPLFDLANDQVALDSARESLVLLKNANHVLPLDAGAIKTIAVIGPDANPGYATAGGSSHIDTFRTESILGGITDYLGQRVHVLYDRGLPAPDTVFKRDGFATAGGQPGLQRETFDNPDFRGTPAATAVDARIDQWKPELWTTPAVQRRSIRWSGRYVAPHAGRYLFLTAAASADSYTLYVDGKAVIVQPKREGQAPLYAALDLKAGQAVAVRLDYLPDVDYSRMGLGVVPVDELISPAALKMAAMADAAVVAVGFDPTSESEAYDRTYALPWGQEALIEAVAKANPKTVVTVTSGGGYATADWLGQVPALLQNWYPGQEGGRAVAEVLFGARSPEGKLPISFERRWEDNPTHDYYYAPSHAPGTHPTVHYGEGLFVGYRWYTSHPDKPQPLFPFGYGLSYTTFAFSGLEVKPSAAHDGDTVQVSFDVRNTGTRAGAEVAQVYVSDPSATVERPERELKAFEKVELAPGQSRRVTLALDRRAFAYYAPTHNDWKVDPGRFVIRVGDASDHTPLAADLTMGKAR